MLHHPPASRSRGSARTFALLAAALAGGAGAWWFARGGANAPPSNLALRSDTPVSGAGAAVDVGLTPPEAPSAEPAARAAVAPEPLTPVAFDIDRPLRGTLPPEVVLPRGESLEVVVEVMPAPKKEDAGMAAARAQVWPDSVRWIEVARIRPHANGRFEAPRPTGVALVRVRPVGSYVIGGEVRYTPGEDDEPGDATFELPISFGGRVTLQLRFDSSVPSDEIAALEGRVLEFSAPGSGLADTRGRFSRPMTCSVAISASARAQLDSVSPYAGAFRVHADAPLGPFLFPSDFQFEPRVGEHIVIEVPMERGTRFEGRIVDTTGAGLVDAKVSVTTIEGTGISRRRPAQRTSTVADGRFVFPALRPRVDQIAVTARGYLDLSVGPVEAGALVAAGQPATLTLERGGELDIRAKLADGRVAAGVDISARTAGADEAKGTRTDAEGRAKFIGLPPGPIELSSTARELQPRGPDASASRTLFTVRLGHFGEVEGVDAENATLWTLAHEVTERVALAGEPVEVVFQRAPTVRGRIEGVDPAWPGPLALSIQRDDPSLPRWPLAGSGTSSLPVDQTTGEFAGQVAPGAYIAFAASGGREDGVVTAGSPIIRQTAEVQFEVANDDIELVLRFASSASPSGVVRLGAGGPPLPMVDVVLSRRESRFYTQCGATRTDDNGAFRFEAQPRGEYMLRVASTRHVMTNASMFTIEADLHLPETELVVQEGGAVRISVVDSQGRSIESPQKSVIRPDGSPTNVRPIEESGDWRGALGPLSPGTYVAHVTQSIEGAPQRIHRAEFSVRAGEVSEVTLRETESSLATLSGTVTSQAGPVEGIRVWCSDALGTSGDVRTDASGAYRMDLMTTGPAVVRVGDSRARPLEEVDIVVVEGPNALPLISVPSGAIEGSMSESHALAMRSMPAAFRVGAAPDEPPAGRATSMMNGKFTIPYLPDGEYIVQTVAVRGAGSDRAIPVRVTIRNGEVVRGVKIEFEEEER